MNFSDIINFSDYDRLLPLVTNSLIAGALLALIGGLVGVFVMNRELSFAVHGIAELSFAGAAIALLGDSCTWWPRRACRRLPSCSPTRPGGLSSSAGNWRRWCVPVGSRPGVVCARSPPHRCCASTCRCSRHTGRACRTRRCAPRPSSSGASRRCWGAGAWSLRVPSARRASRR